MKILFFPDGYWNKNVYVSLIVFPAGPYKLRMFMSLFSLGPYQCMEICIHVGTKGTAIGMD